MKKYKEYYAIVCTNNERIEGFYISKPDQSYVNDLSSENHMYFEAVKGIRNIYLAQRQYTESEIRKQFKKMYND